MNQQNIFVMGLDEFNRGMLERLRGGERLAIHPLLDFDALASSDEFDIPELLSQARQSLRTFPGAIDAIVNYWDFPSCLLTPVLRRDLGLSGPSLEQVLRFEHKYWARREEHAVAPRHTPKFARLDPFDKIDVHAPPLPFPFWLKPICAHSSKLGFRIADSADFAHAIASIRKRIGLIAEPFNEIYKLAQLPPAIAPIDGTHCIAEEIISAHHQCTLEGYVLQGKAHIYGVVDSLREGDSSSSFTRYEYPSQLAEPIKAAMSADAIKLVQHMGYDNAPFNIEYFYDEASGAIHMLEINSRISKSHSPLFEMVDGASNMQIMVDVALRRQPDFPQGRGRFAHAAKFMLRQYRDAWVERVPSAAQVRAIEQENPGCRIQIEARPGQFLSEMQHQDSYSYETAVIFVGAESRQALRERADAIERRLDIELIPEHPTQSLRDESGH